jgi:tetratricopeptide (TPR) repeat protein
MLVSLGGLVALTAWNVTRSTGLSEAGRAYAQGDLTGCLQHALDHLKRRPWSRQAYLLAARCLSRLDYAEAAEPYYKRAGDLDLNDLQTRAYALVRGNHRHLAIQAYKQIIARWPDNVTALRRLAAVQLSENNIPELEKLADRLIQSPGGAAIGYTLQGVLAHNDRNYERAVASFERVLEVDPDLELMPLPRQLFWNHLAENLIASGRVEDASQYLTQILRETPDAPLMNTLGRAYFLQGMLDEAERSYQQAAEWEPDNHLPFYALGKIELQRRRPAVAQPYLEAARKRAPRRIDVLSSLAIAYRLTNEPAKAANMESLVNELRQRPKPGRNPKDPWPSYSL